MQVQDFFTNLAYGELQNLSRFDAQTGVVDAVEHNRLVHLMNRGLVKLNARFPQHRAFYQVQMSADRQKYQMVAGADYILDSEEDPFTGDFLKIVSVTVLDDVSTDLVNEYQPLRMGDRDSEVGIQMLAWDTFFVRSPIDDRVMEVELQMAPQKLSLPVDLTEVVPLVPVLEEALELYVASRFYAGMNGEENAVKTAQLMNEYESFCAQIEQQDILQLSTSATHDRLMTGGFL